MLDGSDTAPDALLRTAGLRVTATRTAVFEALTAKPHASADEVFDRIRDALPGTSMQSVYDVLGDFVDAGLARIHEEIGRAQVRTPVTNAHLVCRLLLEQQ